MKWFLAKEWAWAFVGEAVMRLGSLVSFALLFPLVGAAPSGLVLAGYAYSMTAWLLVDLGLGFYGVKRVAEQVEPASTLQAEISVARLMLSVVATPVLVWALLAVLRMPLFVALSFAGFLVFRSLSADWRLRGEARFKTLAIVSCAASGAQIATLALFVRRDTWAYSAALPWLVWALALMIGTWAATGMRPAQFIRSPPRRALAHLSGSMGFSLSNGSSVLFGQVPIIALSLAFPPAHYAGFALIHRLVLSSNLFFQSLGAALFPRIVRASKGDPEEAWAINAHAIRLTLGLGTMIVGLFLAAYATPILRETYMQGVSVIALLAMAAFLIVRSVRENIMRLLLARGSSVDTARVVTIVLVLFVVVLAAIHWIGRMGVDEVAVAFMGSEALMLWILLRVARAPKAVHVE